VYCDVSIGLSGSWFCICVVSIFRNMLKSALSFDAGAAAVAAALVDVVEVTLVMGVP
jgi:hypothetical protein